LSVTSARKEPQPEALNRPEQRDAPTQHVGEGGRIVNITDVLTINTKADRRLELEAAGRCDPHRG
jgi:hypothetical protein